MPVFGIDSLRACVPVDIDAYEIVPVFGIESLKAVPGLRSESSCKVGIYYRHPYNRIMEGISWKFKYLKNV